MELNSQVLSDLPNETARKTLLKIIENNVPTTGYCLQLEPGAAKGDNFMATVYRLNVIFKGKNQSKAQKLGLFVKCAPVDAATRDKFLVRICFLREATFYSEILPTFIEFQKSKGIIPKVNGFKEYAKCYSITTNAPEETVFMEDLSLQDFVMNKALECPTVESVKVAVRALGKLHALSFALKNQLPQRFAKYKNLEEVLKSYDSDGESLVNGLRLVGYECLSKRGDKKYLEHFRAFVENKPLYERILELVDGSKAEPYAVLCHGDCWTNNILFKYENGRPTDVRLVDWQISRYASPVCDLVYLVFCCTTKAMRDEHFGEVLKAYYSELSEFMQRLGSDTDIVFPYSAFQEQLKRFGAFGIWVLFLVTIKTLNVTSADDISIKFGEQIEETFLESVKNMNSELKLKVRDTIVDLIELGWI